MQRRDFLRHLPAVVAGAATSRPAAVEAAGQRGMSFTLTSPEGGARVPFCIGFAFRQGDVPRGKGVVGSIASLQVVAKNRWPDGSLKFALVSGHAQLPARRPVAITLQPDEPDARPPLTTSALKDTGAKAIIGCGQFGAVSWEGADWDRPWHTWVSGAEMSSWIYRKPVGTDPHLVGWLEVRLFADGQVEVLPWIENGYLRVPGPTNKPAQYMFALGGTERFSAQVDLPNHCRTPLLRGTSWSHWLGDDPRVTPRHDPAYLEATRLVPSYSARVPANSAVLDTLVDQYMPLQQGNFPGSMGAGGYDPSIGLLPEWDVLHLVSSSARPYPAVIFNGYGAGRYGIHFRDETTQRPIRFSAYPHLVVGDGAGIRSTGASTTGSFTPAATGTVPPTWASSHHPSVGFMAYLLTGRWYFLEELQFAATLNYLKNSDSPRKREQGVFLTNAGANTTRGTAWSLRTLAQAACMTPDGDDLKSEFVASFEANVAHYHAQYIAQPNNPFGFVTPYSDYTAQAHDDVFYDAGWMQDFFIAALGYAISLRIGLSSRGEGELAQFFAWKARSVIGRLGSPGEKEYLYRDAATYTLAVAPTDKPDFARGQGPWHAHWGEVYAHTFAKGSPGPRTEGGLRGGNFPSATSYWGNLQPAVSYAVEHGVPGAAEAYVRMTGADNWWQLARRFDDAPVWSVVPYGWTKARVRQVR